MAEDSTNWYIECETCRKFLGKPMRPPMKSVLADDGRASLLPWTDVMIDVQGPYTRAEGGEMYVLSYHCTVLKVPFLRAMSALTAGEFSRALWK